MADYSVSEAFQQIEEYLISSMIRNMARHLSEEQREGFRYTQWQAEQLAALAEYRTANEKRFKGYFSKINESIELALRRAHQSGKMAQEAQILEALKSGWDGRRVRTGGSMTAEFFRINEEKLTAYIKAVVKDMERAETALLRMADDQYRKTIFNAGVAYNTGAYTLPQAIDAATKDYLSKGLACIEYRNGARVLIDTYAEMALRTSVTRSYLMGESAKRDEWGVNTVIVARRGAACPKCLQYVGRVFYDDVYGSIPVPDDKYPRLSSAIEGGLYHPNCKDIHTTYFEGVSTPPKPLTSAQEKRAAEIYDLEQRQRYNERQIRKYRRLADNTLDPEQKQKYTARLKQWQQVNADFVEAHGDVLKRRYEREDIRELAVRVERPPVAEEKTLDKSVGSGIIKSLDIDDFELMAGAHKIDSQIVDTIASVVKKYEKSKDIYISDFLFGSLPPDKHGTPLLQIEPIADRTLRLNVNTDIFAGRTLKEVDAMIEATTSTVARNLEEAVIHECGHAKSIKGKTIEQIKDFYAKIAKAQIKGISKIALADGAEALAEIEVLLSRGDSVSAHAMEFYNDNMGRK